MTHDEIRAAIVASPDLQNLVPDTVALAVALSEGRQKPVPTEIGIGTILALMGGNGGVFLDTLVAVGEQNRDVYWTMDLIRQGRLRIDMPATRAGMQALAGAVPSLADGIAALLTLGFAADPVSEFDVRAAIFADDGALRI